MLTVKYTRLFKKNYSKLAKAGRDLTNLGIIIEKLSNELLLDRIFNDHQLKGNYKDCRECHLAPDLLLIYRIENNLLVLVNIGSHSELFE